MTNNITYHALFLVLGFATALGVSMTIISPALADIKQNYDTKANCASAVFPQGDERDIQVDLETGLVSVGYTENVQEKHTLLNFKSNDEYAGCTQQAKELLKLVKQGADKIITDSCADMNATVEGKAAAPQGFNPEGGKRFITHWCGK